MSKDINVCVVSNYGCDAPAGWGSSAGYATNTMLSVGATRCYICGESVCKHCSALVTWQRRRVRACDNCVPLPAPADA